MNEKWIDWVERGEMGEGERGRGGEGIHIGRTCWEIRFRQTIECRDGDPHRTEQTRTKAYFAQVVE